MDDLYPASDFDSWAPSYDDDVRVDQFPFEGYTQALETVVRMAEVQAGMRVLDLGTGTGNLAMRFAALGCALWCTDFSPAMLERARCKLPQARFALHDIRQEDWPPGFGLPFDRIVSAYVFHHFDLDEKIRILQRLSHRLKPGGRLILADVAFPSRMDMEAAERRLGDAWEQEEYWLADEASAGLERAGFCVGFVPVSYCAGVFHLTPSEV